MVDLAGGLGYYSHAFAERGIAVTYVDTDPVSVAFVRNTIGERVEVVESTIEDFCRTRGDRFDVIFLRHAIEHCREPDQVLRLMRSISSHKTILVLETDNNSGVELLFHPGCRTYWRSVYRDHYGVTSIAKLCRMHPLAIDQIETHYFAFRMHNLAMLLRRTGWHVLDSFHYSLGDPVYWPNMLSAGAYRWWRPRVHIRAWIREVEYALMHPMLSVLRVTSGLAVYATPADGQP